MLLVDDHAIVREGLTRVLCAKGSNWALTEAETGFQALELLRTSEFATWRWWTFLCRE
jgi:DNA-binding NarL/FixJ family response regulator